MANEFWAGLFRGLGEGVGGIPDILQQRAEIENRNKMMAFELALGERGSKRKTKAARRAFLRKESLQNQADRAALARVESTNVSRERAATTRATAAGKPIALPTEAEQMAANAEFTGKWQDKFFSQAIKLYSTDLKAAEGDEELMGIVMNKIQAYIDAQIDKMLDLDMSEIDAEADSLKRIDYVLNNPYIQLPIDSSFTFDPQPADVLR